MEQFDDIWNARTTPEDHYEKQAEMIQCIEKLRYATTEALSNEGNEIPACILKARDLFLNRKRDFIRADPGEPFSIITSIDGNIEENYIPGVIPTIERLFCPWTTSDPRKKSRSEMERRASSASYEPRKISRSCPTYGAKHGRIVHREVAYCVEAIKRPERMIQELIDNVPSPDPCTIRLLDFLILKGWIPLESEFPIWDEPMYIATAIDLAAIDISRQELIAIELKTGYENEEYTEIKGDHLMLPPCESLRDCPDNRHQLQLMTTLLISKVGYNIDFDAKYVINTCSKRRGANLIEQNDWCKNDANYAKLYNAIINRDSLIKKKTNHWI